MIANIWPELENLEETISTLKFATRMMRVSNEATVNINQDPEVLIKKYEREIRDLKRELIMHNTLFNKGRITYEPEPPEVVFSIAKKFLTGQIDDIEQLDSIPQCRDLMHQMRLVYRKLEQNARVSSSKHDGGSGADDGLDTKGNFAELERRKTLIDEDAVGDEDEGHNGFGIGKAPKESRPQNPILMKKSDEKDRADDEEDSKAEADVDGTAEEEGKVTKGKKKKQTKNKQEAFKEYKEDEGKNIEESIKQNRNDLRTKKKEMEKLKEVCNKAKKEIDTFKAKLENKNEEKQKSLELDEEEDVIDEEEFNILKQLKDQKKLYRENFDKFKQLKGDCFYIQNCIDQLKEQLIFKFEVWFDENFDQPHGSKEVQRIMSHDDFTDE